MDPSDDSNVSVEIISVFSLKVRKRRAFFATSGTRRERDEEKSSSMILAPAGRAPASLTGPAAPERGVGARFHSINQRRAVSALYTREQRLQGPRSHGSRTMQFSAAAAAAAAALDRDTRETETEEAQQPRSLSGSEIQAARVRLVRSDARC